MKRINWRSLRAIALLACACTPALALSLPADHVHEGGPFFRAPLLAYVGPVFVHVEVNSLGGGEQGSPLRLEIENIEVAQANSILVDRIEVIVPRCSQIRQNLVGDLSVEIVRECDQADQVKLSIYKFETLVASHVINCVDSPTPDEMLTIGPTILTGPVAVYRQLLIQLPREVEGTITLIRESRGVLLTGELEWSEAGPRLVVGGDVELSLGMTGTVQFSGDSFGMEIVRGDHRYFLAVTGIISPL